MRLLATSREGFGLPDERLWALRSLAVSDTDAESSDAVVLFSERARALRRGFALDASTTPTIVELCRRLDGIPLAIELAAARVATMTPAEIVAHLDERFRLLTGGRRGRVERHQTLRAAVEWSYSLLDDTERAVFECLGVFPASFDEAAAIAVCASRGIERWDVIDALAGLVAKSMLDAEGVGDVTRYRLLETLRHFARDRAGDLDDLRRGHATHFAALATDIGEGVTGREELQWRARLVAELDNLRAAAGWAFEAERLDDVSIGLQILDALLLEAFADPSLRIYTWAAPVVARVVELDPPGRAAVHAAASVDAYHHGDREEMLRLSRLAIADSVRLTRAYSTALITMAGTGGPMALAAIGEAEALLHEEGAPEEWRHVMLLSLRVNAALVVGDAVTARSAADDNLSIAQRLGTPSWQCAGLWYWALARLDDDPLGALAAVDEAIRRVDAGALDIVRGPLLLSAAVLRGITGDLAGAARATAAGVEVLVGRGNPNLASDCVAVAATVLAGDAGHHEAAAILDGAGRGPILGALPLSVSLIHRARIDAATQRVAASLGPAAFASAQHRGAAMSYDEIVAFTLDRLADLAEASG